MTADRLAYLSATVTALFALMVFLQATLNKRVWPWYVVGLALSALFTVAVWP